MRIAIYNRYWNTRGGGERYAGLVAEILSRHHEVELLGPDPVDLEGLAAHLGLDFFGVRYRLLPPANRESELTPLTTEYDLFVNATYLSRLRPQAPRSVYVVLFPQRTWPAWLVRAVRRLLEPFAVEDSALVEAGDGFYERDDSGARWSEGRFAVRLHPDVFRRRRARLRFAPVTPWPLEDAILDVGGPVAGWRVDGDELVVERSADADGTVDLQVECRTFVPAEHGRSRDWRSLGLCLTGVGARGALARARTLAARVAGRVSSHDAAIPASYDLLLSISEFTRHWVERRWGLDSEVLAPPVDVAAFTPPEPGGKRKVILSVGRFFHGSHNKKHLQMLRVFRRMHDRGEIPPGWEYHLVGNLHRDRLVDLEYFADVERLAEGYPVKLLIDLRLDDLVEEYRRASIFWHAAGWGESEERRPEKLEHFGLTTCEAMSAGCIPVVIARAGQLEIVEHGETGFLFSDARELATLTRRLIEGHGEPWTEELRRRAVAGVRRFGREPFERRLWELLEAHHLLADGPAPGDAMERAAAMD